MDLLHCGHQLLSAIAVDCREDLGGPACGVDSDHHVGVFQLIRAAVYERCMVLAGHYIPKGDVGPPAELGWNGAPCKLDNRTLEAKFSPNLHPVIPRLHPVLKALLEYSVPIRRGAHGSVAKCLFQQGTKRPFFHDPENQ